ncbi:heme peroxidase family protein [Granulicella sp. S190]|uniref:peroxidase family protein n=1 Tax=Granulicella sp. S190 TaxID=1747226 RepID=UPI00131C0DF0|nr:heme peroxidase family protein [Granulicella sp. S190]
MPPVNNFRPHGGVRGANLSRSSLLFDGPFGKMFRAVPPADFGPDDPTTLSNLAALATAMTSVADPQDPKDGPDNEESGIPAAYTYFGQFIDHDLTFDPASSLQKQNDPDALVDFRTPQFDMDNLYGRGPDDQPYLYTADGRSFVLGNPMTGAPEVNGNAHDLQRNQQTPARALIGDPRNDENKIVSQLQGLWQRFHNKIAKDNPTLTFPQVQQMVRFHYQWILLHDFLPTIIAKEVLEGVLPFKDNKSVVSKANLQFFHYKNFAFMPLEFSAAAYRFGHSMVRPGYRVNSTVGPQSIFKRGANAQDLRGFQAPPPDWALDWRRYIDLVPLDYGTLVANPDQNDPTNKNRLQLAYKIDTSLVNPLGVLPPSVAVNPSILAQRNLERGWRMRLPSGQDVARAMGLVPLTDDKIVIGKFTGDPGDIVAKSVATVGDGKGFVGNCPLWTYVLAETIESKLTVKTLQGDKKIATRKLGPVGGRIVAETFVGLLLADSSSYVSLNPLWTPSLAVNGVFGLREMIQHALAG